MSALNRTIKEFQQQFGVTVVFMYGRVHKKDGFVIVSEPSTICGEGWLPGGITECMIVKDDFPYSIALARCNPVDKFNPRVGRAISFFRALEGFDPKRLESKFEQNVDLDAAIMYAVIHGYAEAASVVLGVPPREMVERAKWLRKQSPEYNIAVVSKVIELILED